jgi:DNA-binding GntR family transcriptional regulator
MGIGLIAWIPSAGRENASIDVYNCWSNTTRTGRKLMRKSPTTRTEEIYARIKDDLAAGVFAPGEHIVEADLATRYGAGRGPVRSALYLLVSDGIAEYVPNHGVFLKRISLENLRTILKMLCALSPVIAESSIEHLDRKAWHRASAAVKKYRDQFNSHDFGNLRKASLDMEVATARLSGDVPLTESVERLVNALTLLYPMAPIWDDSTEESSCKNALLLEQYLDALTRDDKAGACDALTRHWQRKLDIVMRWH